MAKVISNWSTGKQGKQVQYDYEDRLRSICIVIICIKTRPKTHLAHKQLLIIFNQRFIAFYHRKDFKHTKIVITRTALE